MKIETRNLPRFLESPDPAIRVVLLYGPDQGLARERADALARGVVPDPSDPFRIAEFAGDALKGDPAKLADEAAAIAFGGGRRVVRVRPAGNDATKALSAFLANPVGDALILLEAGELDAKSSLRKLVEAAPLAAAIACYHDEGKSLESVIRDHLVARKIRVAPDALAWLVDHLGGDRRVTRGELDKLALYAGPAAAVSLADAQAAIGDSADIDLDDLVNWVAEGDAGAADRALSKLWAEGADPVPVVRALARHFVRLQLAAGLVDEGKDPESAVAALRLPAAWKTAPRVVKQLRRWSRAQLDAALSLLLRAELQCKTTGQPAELLAGRAVLALSRRAPDAAAMH